VYKVDVLKDMVMLREHIGIGDYILSDTETELVICTVCTD